MRVGGAALMPTSLLSRCITFDVSLGQETSTIVSNTMYELNGFRKSTPPKNRRLIV